ncbi:hypothetical protein FHR32_001125 [Streptosporangium album]|uniref:Uncharacterized protein n=1 Tax=Streptosporangium album TaxID=47479 RepID=A0A7W7RRJ9_9ACTN|nr:hypothetical protein [Streptosporangium album]MBB4936820.1 hypothetical protein [Streptosporangium album]
MLGQSALHRTQGTFITGSTCAALAGDAHLPHYGHAAALIGISILLAILIIVAIAIFRSGRK